MSSDRVITKLEKELRGGRDPRLGRLERSVTRAGLALGFCLKTVLGLVHEHHQLRKRVELLEKALGLRPDGKAGYQ